MPITKEWSKFIPENGYEKEMQDVRLKDGTVLIMCWPNAGYWNVCSDENPKKYVNAVIRVEDTDEVRLTHSKNW